MVTNKTHLFLVLLLLGAASCREHIDVKKADAAYEDRLANEEKNKNQVVDGIVQGITKVETGYYDSCLIKSGRLYCWGPNEYGTAGDGSYTSVLSPTQVETDDAFEERVTDVSVGESHTCAIEDGDLYCWGDDTYGQLGSNSCFVLNEPCLIDDTKTYSKVSAGIRNTCAISSGRLYCWGSNSYGQIGNGSYIDTNIPQLVFSQGVTDVSVGQDSVCAVVNKAVYCWGNNTYGQLGNGTTSGSSSPIRIISNSASQVSVSMADNMACARVGSALQCWGQNSSYQIGDGTTTTRKSPKTIFSSGVTNVSVKMDPCAVVSGDLKCWGPTSYTTITSNKPTTFKSDVSNVSTGGIHACFLSTSNQAFCWGYNDNGSAAGILGIGSSDDVYSEAPTEIIILED